MQAIARPALTALLVLSISTAIFPRTARAWHESGHRLVARIAWDELTSEQRGFVSGLLVHHPRFAEDFVARMPAEIQSLPETDAKRRQWVFMHAAIWPDLIKEEVKRLRQSAAGDGQLAAAEALNHSTWHYDNKPIFVDPYALAVPPTSDPRGFGIQRALPAVLRELADASAADERRAVALAWLVHLLGDSHQPLHAATIFTADALPQGDLGGNRVIVTTPTTRDAPGNLHAVWDGLFNDVDESAEQRRIVAAHPRTGLQAELAAPAGASLEGRINLWLDESYRLADAAVYDEGVRAALRAPLPLGATPAPIALDRRYLQTAKVVAARRVALAGYRLADCIDLVAPRP